MRVEPPTKPTIELAKDILTRSEFSVWIAKHVVGHGRRRGSLVLGISEDAWRYRLQQADMKMTIALREAA